MAAHGRYDYNYDYNINYNNDQITKKKIKNKSGPMMIPKFGEWEDANEMPITQYFENPRQAGLLLRHHYITPTTSNTTNTSSSSSSSSSSVAETLNFTPQHRPRHLHPQTQTAGRKEKRGPQQRRVRDVSAQTERQYVDVTNGVKQFQNGVVSIPKAPKPVDEDLYKIPPELINSSRRKKMPGFLACLVPCAS